MEAQAGVEGATLELYRTALAIRRNHLVDDESLEWLDLGGDVIAFRRGSGVVCVVNFGTEPVALPEGEILASSEGLVDGALTGNAGCWLLEP